MQTIPKIKKDFEWVSWGTKEIASEIKRGVEHIQKAYSKIKAVPDAERTFENTLYALESSDHLFKDTAECIVLLKETSPDKKIRDFAHKILDAAQKELIDIAYDREIYKAVKYYAEKNAKKEKLAEDEKLLLRDTLRGYKRMGFDLPTKKLEVLKKNLKELSELESKFSKNLNDYQDHITVTEADLDGLPDTYKKNLKKDKKGNYLVSLQYPELGPFMQFSKNAKKREELARKDLQQGGKENVKLLQRIIRLRHAKARMLGYQSHAHYAIENNMAKTPAAAWKLIHDMNRRSRKASHQELEELRVFKAEETADPHAVLRFFDIAYYTRILKKNTFSIDAEEVRKYFPFTKVKEGVFAVYVKLFSVTFEKMKGVPTIHPDVEMFEVKDKRKNIIGYFSLDLYPRDGKFSHLGAMFPIISGRTASFRSDTYVAPYAAMVGNFAKPLSGKPSYMSHGEVQTFFHEFGHLMHGVLTRARYSAQAGTSVAIDFVEVPSQMFENWAWDKKIIISMSEHHETRAVMPTKMISDLIASKRFLPGYSITRQTTLGMLDMSLHWRGKTQNPDKLYIKMVKENTGIDLPKEAIFTAGFGHLMGYDAGYYSYLWSLVYAYDIFSRFKKEGLLNTKTGADLKRTILEKGGSREEMDSMKEFLGRKPNNKAFLEEMGLK